MTKLAKKNNTTKYALKYVHPNVKNWGALAMMAGAEKYGAWNFLDGHKLTDLLDAMERHIDMIRQGEWNDPDCSERLDRDVPHLGCIVAGVNMIAGQLAKGTLVDDRHDYLDKMAGDFDVLPSGSIETAEVLPPAVVEAVADLDERFQVGARWNNKQQNRVRVLSEVLPDDQFNFLFESSGLEGSCSWSKAELATPSWTYIGDERKVYVRI